MYKAYIWIFDLSRRPWWPSSRTSGVGEQPKQFRPGKLGAAFVQAAIVSLRSAAKDLSWLRARRRIVANFVLAWRNAGGDGGFDLTDLRGVGEKIADDMLKVFRLLRAPVSILPLRFWSSI